jgi:redox-sensitive bicupin YhaK (pirin superfamily)
MMIESLINPPQRSLGDGITVRRALPSAQRRSVGPFVFFDQMGPFELTTGRALDVRPHPHIGLATVTYLFEGEIMHRDSLGNELAIRPGELNWMTAGRGIVHSERTPQHLRTAGARLFGVQSWVALHESDEECEPGFVHHGADELPVVEDPGIEARIVTGALHGAVSPVVTSTATLYADVKLGAGAAFPFDAEHEERALYVVQGEVEIGGRTFPPEQLLVLRPGDRVTIRSVNGARFMALGGDAMGRRHIWWNFVSSSRERIEQAKADWQAGRFAAVPNDDERIPLPEAAPKPVIYP